MSSAEPEVKFEVINGAAGVITLNRPKALNSLNAAMANSIYNQLNEWKDSLKLIVIEGSGEKAFCAGGDIKSITERKGSKDQTDFFKMEYHMNNLIGSLKIPYVALIDGITMGGGVGLSLHGRYRVATEKTLFAMPETGIGLIPDVGGSYFLPRLPHGISLGMYLALTGARLKGAANLHAGVATHFCAKDDIPELRKALVENPDDVESVLSKHSKSDIESFPLDPFMEAINRTFSAEESVTEVLTRLKAEAGNSSNSEEIRKWATQTEETIRKMSPTSLVVSHKLLKEGAKLNSLAECLTMEFRLVTNCCKDPDFYEGVRALLLDRDNNPKWSPAKIEDVTEETVQRYFSKLPEELDLSSKL